MDLSFRPFDPAAASQLPAADMALLVAMLTERQAASATAQVQAALTGGHAVVEQGAAEPLAPVDGSFNPAMAARMIDWKQA